MGTPERLKRGTAFRAIAASLLLVLLALAAGVRGDISPDSDDPFAPDARMPSGPFKGRTLDTHEQRSVRLLGVNEIAALGLTPAPGSVVVANVRHAGRFWIAELCPDAVEEVILQVDFFKAVVPAAHTELRFRFAPGREPLLTPQSRGARRDSVRLRDLVYSVEAVSILEGEPYDLMKGMQSHFGTAYRLVSLEDRYQDMVVKSRQRVQQLRLRLGASGRARILLEALRLGDRARMTAIYNTLTLNCTTELFRVIDDSARYDFAHASLKNLGFFLNALPTQAGTSLRLRGLLPPGKSGALPDLDREFATPGARGAH